MKTKNMKSDFSAMTMKTYQALFVIILVAVLQISAYGNMAENPSMEGNFIPQGSLGDVAEGWTGWFLPVESSWEFSGTFMTGYVAREDVKSQGIGWYSNGVGAVWRNSDGDYGIYQQINSLEAGEVYKVSCWFKGVLDIEPFVILDLFGGLDFYGEIGADPGGGIDPNAALNWRSVLGWSVIPTGERTHFETLWLNTTTYFSAQGNTATIFARTSGVHGYAYNQNFSTIPDIYSEPFYLNCYIDYVTVELVEIGEGSTVEATTPIPANGVSYSRVNITVVDANGDPLANIPASEIVVDCTGSGNTIIGPDSPTDANGQTTARITSTVVEAKTVSVTVFGTVYTAFVQFIAYEPIWYVDADAPGGNDGLSWADAFTDLQAALSIAAGFTQFEVWVAQGVYKPAGHSGARTETFQLLNGIAVRGGYAGFGELDPNARDITIYETILSGDLTGNDVDVNDPCDLLTDPTRTENSYHVVTGSGTDQTAVLDGFTITGGNANGSYPYNYGGGLVVDGNSSPTLTDCRFADNSAGWGGGMGNYGNPGVTSCTFTGNSADNYGGGMYNEANRIPTVTNCTFIGNYSAGWGGGMVNNSSSPTVTNCTFTGNSAELDAGGILDYQNSPMVTNCAFSGNLAGEKAGGIYNYDSSPTLTNCTFSGNSAGQGGGILNYESSLTIGNCILWGNTAGNGPQIALDSNSTATISYCDLQGGQTAAYLTAGSSITWGQGNIDADPLFLDDDNADPNLRDYHLLPGSPCIDAGDNTAVLGGITTDLNGFSRFIDHICTSDTGNGISPIVDMGAYEFLSSDIDGNGDVNFKDFSQFTLYWLEIACGVCGGADLTCDADVNGHDLKEFADNWLEGIE